MRPRCENCGAFVSWCRIWEQTGTESVSERHYPRPCGKCNPRSDPPDDVKGLLEKARQRNTERERFELVEILKTIPKTREEE